MQTDLLKPSVCFDRSCPLRRAEIAHCRSAALCFADVPETDVGLAIGLSLQRRVGRIDRGGRL